MLWLGAVVEPPNHPAHFPSFSKITGESCCPHWAPPSLPDFAETEFSDFLQYFVREIVQKSAQVAILLKSFLLHGTCNKHADKVGVSPQLQGNTQVSLSTALTLKSEEL